MHTLFDHDQKAEYFKKLRMKSKNKAHKHPCSKRAKLLQSMRIDEANSEKLESSEVDIMAEDESDESYFGSSLKSLNQS